MQPARLAIFIALALAGVSPILYASETFNTELVELDNPGMGKADLSAFESGSQAPGTYHVDIILDDRLLETRDIRFMAVKDANGSEYRAVKSVGRENGAFPTACRRGR